MRTPEERAARREARRIRMTGVGTVIADEPVVEETVKETAKKTVKSKKVDVKD